MTAPSRAAIVPSHRAAVLWLCLLPVLGACGGEPELAEPRDAGSPIEIGASLDRSEATIGDLLTLEVRVNRREAIEVEEPQLSLEDSGLALVETVAETVEGTAGRAVDRFRYRLRVDEVGRLAVAPVTVAYREGDGESGEVRTEPLEIEVRSLLAEAGDAADIRDIKPVEPPKSVLSWPWLLALAAVVGLIGLLLWRRRRRRLIEESLATSPPLPHVWALTALGRLQRVDLSTQARIHRWTFELSEVVREYVERRFGLNATDLTTEEIEARLPEIPALPRAEAERLAGLLRATDRVKFADEVSDADTARGRWRSAVAFVEATVRAAGAETEEARLQPDREPSAGVEVAS